MKETTNFLHLWKRWGFLFFRYYTITTIHVLSHTQSHLKWSDLAMFDFCLPQTESSLENGIKSMKLSQNLFFLNLSLRLPRGSLEKSQKFVLMEITISYLLCYYRWASELSSQKSCYLVLLETALFLLLSFLFLCWVPSMYPVEDLIQF